MRNLMWEYSRTWWLEALSQTYSMSHFVIEFTHDFMVYFTSHPGILGSIKVHRHVLYLHFVLLLQAMGVLALPMTDNFRWSEPSMLVIMRSVCLSLHLAEPAGLSPSKQ